MSDQVEQQNQQDQLQQNGLSLAEHYYEEDSDDDVDDEVGFYKITIPTIMKLEGDSNLAEWKELVRAYGELLGLTKFIDGTAVQPPLAASTKQHNRFRRKKGTAYLMIRNSVTPVMGIIYSYGWIDGESDPHGLYTTTCKAVSDMTVAGWCNLVRELVEIDATKFDSPMAFNARYHYLVAKVKDGGLDIPQKFLHDILLRGLSGSNKT